MKEKVFTNADMPNVYRQLSNSLFLAILKTGGSNDKLRAEIYNPWLGGWCKLPDLPIARDPREESHTQDGFLTCGGTVCHKWNPETGTWDVSHNLTSGRNNKLSWTPISGNGTYLIGGLWSEGEWVDRAWEHAATTVLLKPDGTTENGFTFGGARGTSGAE